MIKSKGVQKTITKKTKKTKQKFKKQVWQDKIALVKDQLKDNADRLKREKTVIVGDVKPMIDSLFETPEEHKKQVQFKLVDVKDKKQQLIKSEAAKRKAEREKSEIAKSIPKESIRTKKNMEDTSLFNQLMNFDEFIKNPIDILKKHLTSTNK